MRKFLQSFIWLFMFSLAACSQADNLYGTWRMEELIFEFGDTQQMEPGYFVELADDYVLEEGKNMGKRRYDGHWSGNVFTLEQEGVTWEVVKQEDNLVHIKTPIGTYVLRRD